MAKLPWKPDGFLSNLFDLVDDEAAQPPQVEIHLTSGAYLVGRIYNATLDRVTIKNGRRWIEISTACIAAYTYDSGEE